MQNNLRIAIITLQTLPGEKLKNARKSIVDILSVKYHMEHLAIRRGYSQACKNAIPACGGECCKYHFPRNLTPVDFFIAIHEMPGKKLSGLSELMSRSDTDYCPLLLQSGCILSFEQRPIICTNAYLCFSDRSYWMEKERKAITVQKARKSISAIISSK